MAKQPCTVHMPFSEDELVDTRLASRILGLSEKTLGNRRALGLGPKYHKQGRSVRYRIRDLLDEVKS